jgi:two-component system nitrate/nitrite response regulator NarL
MSLKDPGRVPEFIRNGIAGVFAKHNAPELLIQAIHEAVQGKTWFEQSLLQTALQSETTTQPSTGVPRLTERERQVLRLVFEGLANKERASRLNVSESAVKASLQQLFAKTGVRTRAQLVRAALDRYRDQI